MKSHIFAFFFSDSNKRSVSICAICVPKRNGPASIFPIFLWNDFRQGRMNNPKGDGCGEIGRRKLAFS